MPKCFPNTLGGYSGTFYCLVSRILAAFPDYNCSAFKFRSPSSQTKYLYFPSTENALNYFIHTHNFIARMQLYAGKYALYVLLLRGTNCKVHNNTVFHGNCLFFHSISGYLSRWLYLITLMR